MKVLLIIGGLVVALTAVRAIRRTTRSRTTPDGTRRSGRMFSMEDEHLTVYSADNLRLLSDEQLAHLERDSE